MRSLLRTGVDGVTRCWWCGDDPLYVEYHDREWGHRQTADHRLFEKLCLEGFQSGLAWITILRKRDNFRRAFAGFDIDAVAAFGESDVERLLGDAGIVRHRGKVRSAIGNAPRAAALRDEFGSLDGYLSRFRSARRPGLDPGDEVPTTSTESVALSTDLRARGWTFVGPTTMYAFLQSVGLVDDHVVGCTRRPAV